MMTNPALIKSVALSAICSDESFVPFQQIDQEIKSLDIICIKIEKVVCNKISLVRLAIILGGIV